MFHPNRRRNIYLLHLMMAMGIGPYAPPSPPPPDTRHKCLLPDCTRLTSHNGGYCCAEHSKLHRRK